MRVCAIGVVMLGWLAAVPAWAQTAAGGANHTIILKSDGTVWTVGANSYGQLGDTTTTMRATPVQVSGLTGVVAVAAGSDHSLALTSTGALYVWGRNTYGTVGDVSTTHRSYPVQSSLASVVAIAAGESHSVALTSSGNVYTWGRNTYGQLGDGTTTQATAPVLVDTGASAIAAGHTHTLIVKTNGTVYATGRNANGQLGDGTTTQRTSPVLMTGISTATTVNGGGSYSVILLADGTLKATGYNAQGQLGDGTTTQRTSPVSVSSLTGITGVAAGQNHTLARKSDGTAWAWGYNPWGQLGDGTTTTRTSPTALTTLSSITKIGTGFDHSVAVSSTGVVFTWGRNASSQLGDGTVVDRPAPTPISDVNYEWKVSTPAFSQPGGTYNTDRSVLITIVTPGATIRYTQNGNEPTESDASLASGGGVTVSSSQTLKAKAFKSGMPASNGESAAYDMKIATVAVSPSTGTYTTAQSVTMTSGTPGTAIRYTIDGSTPTDSSTTYSGAVSVATSTTLKAVGFKTNWTSSDLATRTYTMNFGTLAAPTPDQATGTYTNSVTVALSAFGGATIRYTTNGSTPQPTSAIYTAPFAFDVTTTLKAKAYHPDYVVSAETSRTYTLVTASPTLNPTGGTYAAGQLVTVTAPAIGSSMAYTINGIEPTQSDPAIVSGATRVVGNYILKVKAWKSGANPSAVTTATYTVTGEVTPPAIAAGDNHSLAIRDDGVAWGWGNNSAGQLGDGTTTSPRLLPKAVSGLAGGAAITGATSHSHVLQIDGAVVAFGSNVSGRLGDGTSTARLIPYTLGGLTGVIALDGGKGHTLALKGDGTVLAWGTNAQGEIGDGTTTIRLSPTAVSTLTLMSAVSAGEDYSLALKQNGTIWGWGNNADGQLGDNSQTDRTTAVQVSTISTATAISAGHTHSLALLADGKLWAWGDNNDGKLGDGTETDRLTPVEVAGVTGAIAVAAGGNFSAALDSVGAVWTWGTNGSGQLGDGTTTERLTAAPVSGLTGIVRIAAGNAHMLALASDGSVYAWGANLSGQLGDGTTVGRLTPVVISGAGMTWRVGTPTLSLASGQFVADQSVTVTIADPDATLRYTTTGVDPTGSDATVTSGGSLAINQSQTLKVSGWKTGAPTSVVVARTYELKVVAPTLSPAAGNYGSAQNVGISTTTSGATLRYTLDGTEPTTSSTSYSSAVTVAETLTVKARAYKTGWTASDSRHASFWISGGTVAAPAMTPAGGAQTTPPLVSMSTTTSGATLRYTLDGSTPTAASTIFIYPFLVPVTTTVKVKAFKAGYTPSATTSVTYEVDAFDATATPAIVPAGGHYAVAQTVTITGASGATLRYTTNGTDPTPSSTSITSGTTLTLSKSQVLKVRAWASGVAQSAVRRADFLITGAVSAGATHSLGLGADGRVWAWGANGGGMLGDGTVTTRLTPVQVLTGAAAIAAGYGHSLAAKADGTLWGWGVAGNGVLGNGSSSGQFASPVQVASFTGAVAVAASFRHSLALKSDGTVWAFGYNGDGQLGDGTTTQRTTPVQVVGLSGIVAIAAGRDASYALQTDSAGGGIAWAWGLNADGQLGDGSTLSRSTPTKVTGLINAVHIASGSMSFTASALVADGRVFAWGKNDQGQLGIGSYASQTAATEVAVLRAVRTIGLGTAHAVVVDAAAKAWAWGDRTDGQLGIGDYNTFYYDRAWVPEGSDLGGALAVSGGDAHTLAVMPDGAIHAFGANGGRLGNGGTVYSTVPVAVSGLSLADNNWLTEDADVDGLATWREYLLGTDPLVADSNGNGILDGVDNGSGVSASNPDLDGDGVPNWTERTNGTDPFTADTDGDSVSDLNDAFPLDPTRSMAPSSNPSDTTPPVVTLKAPVTARPVP